MKRTILQKLKKLFNRYKEIQTLLSDKKIMNNIARYSLLSKEFARLEPIMLLYQQYLSKELELSNLATMKDSNDLDFKNLIIEEEQLLLKQLAILEKRLCLSLLPKNPNDNRNVFLEIRAGTGGHEAGIFVGDLYRMYSRLAERKSWKTEIISQHDSGHGGFKEIIVRIIGKNAYALLKFESGAHRVQRVPQTESQGRVHTSACTVAIMPEIDEIDKIDIDPSDLRIDTYRASGAGGQHVNRTDSAVRITHLPTGVVVECQDERSQHKNKARAMNLLQSRLLIREQEKQHQEQAAQRRSLVGSGDRSERIRTYNFPQGRLTDHRINLTLYSLTNIMDGDLDVLIDTLTQEHEADLMAEFE